MSEYYICDPEKNTECSKTFCHDLCWLTAHKEYSRDGIPLAEDEERTFSMNSQKLIDPNTNEWRGFLEEDK